MDKQDRRNKYFFGLGTVGRDMLYAFEANALLYYLSNILSLPIGTFAAASLVLTILRILDALNDPITGLIIDNIRTPCALPIPGENSSRRYFSARLPAPCSF